MPTGVFNFGWDKGEETLFSANSATVIWLGYLTVRLWNSSIVIQPNYDIAQLWNSTAWPWNSLDEAAWARVLVLELHSISVRQLNSLLVRKLCSVSTRQVQLQFYSSSSEVLAATEETVFDANWNCTPLRQVKLVSTENSVCSWSLISPFSCKYLHEVHAGLQILTVWFVHKHCPDWSEWSCSNWSVDMQIQI